jgi:TonB family protein
MAAATLNRARIKTRPEAISMPPPDYPESERAALHGGTAMVHGILGTDGRLSEASISHSTGFPALDSAALAAARLSTFRPAKDADGAAIAVPIAVPETFDPKDTHAVVITAVWPEYPDAERAAGHHGKVEISGTIGPDGRLIDAKVATSSRAPGLDAAALVAARATLFRVRRDAAGQPIQQGAVLPFTFDSYHSSGKGGGILRYSCDQFVKDQDWWRATWPTNQYDEFFSMMLGLRTVVEMGQGRMDAAMITGSVSDLKQRWTRSIEACRAKPEAMFIDMLKPEGDWARRLAEKVAL